MMVKRSGIAQVEIEVVVSFQDHRPTQDDPGDIVMDKITVCQIEEKEYSFTESQITDLPPPFDTIIASLVNKAIEDAE